MKRPTQPLPLAEFVVLLALMISIVAMATDIMLPALSVIGQDLKVAHANDVQLVVSSLFAGFALGQAIVAVVWFAVRQPEILALENRRPLSVGSIARGAVEALSNRTVAGYTLAAGLVFGAFLSYLSSAQQVFQMTFGTGHLFPLYFAIAARAIGLASFTNSRLVMRFGMRVLTQAALIGILLLSGAFVLYLLAFGGVPSFGLFMAWILATFFCVGFLFGNLNALAMEPLGHMAGLGAALIGSISTFLSLPIGWFVAGRFDGGVLPLVAGFLFSGLATLIVMRGCERMAPFSGRGSGRPG